MQENLGCALLFRRLVPRGSMARSDRVGFWRFCHGGSCWACDRSPRRYSSKPSCRPWAESTELCCCLASVAMFEVVTRQFGISSHAILRVLVTIPVECLAGYTALKMGRDKSGSLQDAAMLERANDGENRWGCQDGWRADGRATAAARVGVGRKHRHRDGAAPQGWRGPIGRSATTGTPGSPEILPWNVLSVAGSQRSGSFYGFG